MKPVLTLALARSTFDVPFAEDVANAAFKAIDNAGLATVGPRTLLFDAASVRDGLKDVDPSKLSGLLLLQVTFTDASMTTEIARQFSALPLAIWAFPEPRLGGRLRLNSFCGLNLAAHALGRAGAEPRTLYAAPDAPAIAEDLGRLFTANVGPTPRARKASVRSATERARAADLHDKLAGVRIGLVGQHPDGFDTCRYDEQALAKLADVVIVTITLQKTFEQARGVAPERVAERLVEARGSFQGLDAVDPAQLSRSLALYEAFADLRHDEKIDALAVRCWPEMFTDYGCAACGPMGMLTENGLPCACEADVLGALSLRLLQAAAGSPAWLVDVVDMDAATDTSVLWHCGSAPASMRDETTPLEAQIHSNRKMPLLQQFTLKPGRITIARLSQARNGLRLVLGAGEVVRAPMSFTGTSAVVRLDGGTAAARDVLLGEALEHHVALAYGDCRRDLEAWAALNALDVIDLTPTR